MDGNIKGKTEHISGSCNKAEKVVGNESDGDASCNGWSQNSPHGLRKETISQKNF